MTCTKIQVEIWTFLVCLINFLICFELIYDIIHGDSFVIISGIMEIKSIASNRKHVGKFGMHITHLLLSSIFYLLVVSTFPSAILAPDLNLASLSVPPS